MTAAVQVMPAGTLTLVYWLVESMEPLKVTAPLLVTMFKPLVLPIRVCPFTVRLPPPVAQVTALLPLT